MPGLLLEDELRPESGAQERHLAAGAIAQQVTMGIGTVTMLGVVTVLGRTLSLSEFGVYGLLVSIPTYLIVAKSSVEIAVIKAIAAADEQYDRDRAVTTAAALYAGFGLLTGLFIVFGGWALLGVFDISHALRADARLGLIVLGMINLLGWPTKTAQDVLRGSHRFVASACSEAMAYVMFGVVMTTAILLQAPLWVIAGLGGSLSLLIGVSATVTLLTLQLPYRLRASTLSLSHARTFFSISTYLFVTGIADLVIYSFDRAVLGAFRPIATVGLYEGPVRAHNLIRQLQGTLVLNVLPAATMYIATGDRIRQRDLLVRGTRYVMLAATPLTITLMVFAGPILEVWLGPRFEPAATAMAILVGYWLVGAASAVGGAMLVAAGRVRVVAIFVSCVAVISLLLSLLLTPPLGLDGVVLGTSIPNIVMIPIILLIYCRTFDVRVRALLREAFLPAYATGAALALVELFARAELPLDHASFLLAVVVLAIGVYATIIYSLWLRPQERLLIHTLLTGIRSRVSVF